MTDLIHTPGTRVSIYNKTISGHFFFEGDATVAAHLHGDRYRVRFCVSGKSCERFVDPEGYNAHPLEFVTTLNGGN